MQRHRIDRYSQRITKARWQYDDTRFDQQALGSPPCIIRDNSAPHGLLWSIIIAIRKELGNWYLLVTPSHCASITLD